MFSERLKYRPHIDGLRALAVVLVILFHINPELFPNGYLGVDIFFVISGFVISQSLFKHYSSTKEFGIWKFYLKRFKRLYPALVAMVVVTTVAYVFFGFLWDTNLYLKSAVTSIFAVSNLYFLYHGDNYFEQDLINPLLHTWSLGLEEQFYVIYPIFFLAFLFLFDKLRLKLSYLIWIFFVIVSILYFVFLLNPSNILGHFYFPSARFWELGVGCFLFLYSLEHKQKICANGLIILATVVLLAQQLLLFPTNKVQLLTLLTVVATGVIIYVGLNNKNFVLKFFEMPFVLYIGKISYSLYLWHLPIIYFGHLFLNQVAFFILTPIFSFGVAVLSYKYIETPARYSQVFEKILKKYSLIPASIFLFAAVVFVMVSGGAETKRLVNAKFNSISEDIKSINYIESNFGLGERIQPNYYLDGNDVTTCSSLYSIDGLLNNRCIKQKDNKDLFYLTGDSHATHFVPTFDTSSVVDNLYYSRFARDIITGSKVDFLPEFQMREHEVAELSQEFDKVYYISSFFLSQPQYKDKQEEIRLNLDMYVREIGKNATIIFIAPTPKFATGPESCVLLKQHCKLDKQQDRERISAITQILAELAQKNENMHVYNPYEALCPDDVCLIYNHDTDFLSYRDDDHISVEQGIILAEDFDQWFKEEFGRNK